MDSKWFDRGLAVFVIVLLVFSMAPRCSIQVEYKSADSATATQEQK